MGNTFLPMFSRNGNVENVSPDIRGGKKSFVFFFRSLISFCSRATYRELITAERSCNWHNLSSAFLFIVTVINPPVSQSFPTNKKTFILSLRFLSILSFRERLHCFHQMFVLVQQKTLITQVFTPGDKKRLKKNPIIIIN